ncbi:hypothetical protein [Agrobacterium tumefaciens]|uniref:hypothetical protein n=1 Tax=Agrobacterium tumefaciens TaxID=358 RepID=UPI002857DEF0|nr:hypothetical protein [Agrobacterium tumefaciens]MDR6586887.1 hypothetical protein [Agrobacterium tumefaciens]
MTHTHENPIPPVDRNKVVISAVLAALSVAAISLPIANLKVMGFSGGLALPSPHLLGGVAYLLPLAIFAGIGSRLAPQSRPYQRVVEIVALAVAVGSAIYVIATLLNGMNEMTNANRQMSQMLGSAAARQFSMSGGLSLGCGSVALGLLVLGSVWQAWTGRR